MFLRLFLLTIVIACAASTACMRASKVAVDNTTSEPLLAGFQVFGCDDVLVTSEKQLAPESRRSFQVVTGWPFSGGCVWVVTLDERESATAPVKTDGLYTASRVNGVLTLKLEGEYEDGDSFGSFGFGMPRWLWMGMAVVYAPGAVAALFITGRFFYRYYAKGAR